MDRDLEIAKETARLYAEEVNYNAALRKAKEIYKKAQSLTDQDKGKEHRKLFNDIIADKEDINNKGSYKMKALEVLINMLLSIINTLNEHGFKVYDADNRDWYLKSIEYCKEDDKLIFYTEEERE